MSIPALHSQEVIKPYIMIKFPLATPRMKVPRSRANAAVITKRANMEICAAWSKPRSAILVADSLACSNQQQPLTTIRSRRLGHPKVSIDKANTLVTPKIEARSEFRVLVSLENARCCTFDRPRRWMHIINHGEPDQADMQLKRNYDMQTPS
ncbi:hypothetical protein TWF751_006138 [Orbilia oligospora]|nr:hypothetical protein TWF751_006138 [Orbilia oligospora]